MDNISLRIGRPEKVLVKLFPTGAGVYLGPLLSVILHYAAFPPLDLWCFAWIALVPILTVLNYAGFRQACAMSFLMGMACCALHISWLNNVADLPFLAFLVITFIFGIFFGLFGCFYFLIIKRTRWPLLLVAPPLWVAIEFLRSNFFFLAIPWGLLGHSQHENIAIIQMASLTSVYGISFLVVLVNAAFTEGILWFLKGRVEVTMHAPSSRAAFSSITGALIVVFIMYLWGSYQIKRFDEHESKIITASVIQGNIPQDEKWDPRFRKKILERYDKLTRQASSENPDIVVWPESATPAYVRADPDVYATVRNAAQQTGSFLLLGSASHAKIFREGKHAYKLRNGAFLVDPSGRIVADYYKMRLVPFGEYLPLEGRFPWPRWLVPKNGVFIPGKDPKVFQLPGSRFGVVICWENLFADTFRILVKKGAQFMVNLSNEAWFDGTPASRQILAMSVFRAIENRVSLIRAANTGISSLVDPLGRITDRVMDANGKDLGVTGIMTVEVPLAWGETFYTRHGDVFAVSCSVLSAGLVVSALFAKRLSGIPGRS